MKPPSEDGGNLPPLRGIAKGPATRNEATIRRWWKLQALRANVSKGPLPAMKPPSEDGGNPAATRTPYGCSGRPQ